MMSLQKVDEIADTERISHAQAFCWWYYKHG